MAHGTPLATGEADDQCGAAGPFLLEAGISSSHYIARFFGLTAGPGHAASTKSEAVTIVPEQPPVSTDAAAVPQPHVLEGEVLDAFDAAPGHGHISPPGRIDIGAVIAKALKAAGLMKGP
jgi:hypothetical protein